MPITTYLTDNERETWKNVHDIELNELFQEVREKVSDKYLLQMHLIPTYTGVWPFKKRTDIWLYSLYIDLGHEAQVFNFPAMGSYSINERVNKAVVMTYFYGVLNGHKLKTQKP